jgi:predicted RNA-binding Zn-ribbon protein involved in translation (DUF1610 family)
MIKSDEEFMDKEDTGEMEKPKELEIQKKELKCIHCNIPIDISNIKEDKKMFDCSNCGKTLVFERKKEETKHFIFALPEPRPPGSVRKDKYGRAWLKLRDD